MKLVVIDSHTIFRRGMISCLESVTGGEEIIELAGAEGCRHPALEHADVVIVDPAGQPGVVETLARATHASVVVCSSERTLDTIAAAPHPGVVCLLPKRALTCEKLVESVRAASLRAAPAA